MDLTGHTLIYLAARLQQPPQPTTKRTTDHHSTSSSHMNQGKNTDSS